MSKLILCLMAFSISNIAGAQQLTREEQEAVNNYLFEELTKKNFVKLNRVTKEGNLESCELEFQYVYRDNRARLGAPVFLTGSFSSTWTSGKIPGYMYKINANEFSIKDRKFHVFAPEFIDISVAGESFKAHKSIDFICETGGRCVGFYDKSLNINLVVASTVPFDAQLMWSLTKGGLDNSVFISKIGDRKKTQQELMSFNLCNNEIIEKFTKYIKQLK